MAALFWYCKEGSIRTRYLSPNRIDQICAVADMWHYVHLYAWVSRLSMCTKMLHCIDMYCIDMHFWSFLDMCINAAHALFHSMYHHVFLCASYLKRTACHPFLALCQGCWKCHVPNLVWSPSNSAGDTSTTEIEELGCFSRCPDADGGHRWAWREF